MHRSLLRDHPPLALGVARVEPLIKFGEPWSVIEAGMVIALILLAIVAILLQAGLFGRFSSAVCAYIAFGVAHYSLEEAAAVYPSTAQLYFLPVSFIATGVLGCVLSLLSNPSSCTIPFESGQSSSVAEWREWRNRIGRDVGSTAKGSASTAVIGRNTGVILGMLSSVCMCLAQLCVLSGFTHERRGLGAFQGLLMLNVALFVMFFACWGEAMQSGETAGLVLWLLGLICVAFGTTHGGITSMAALAAVCLGGWAVCLRFSVSVAASGFARFATIAAVGAGSVMLRGLPEWDGTFAWLVCLMAAGTVGGVQGTAAAFARCRPVAAVVILGSFSTMTFLLQLCLQRRWPTVTLDAGLLMIAIGIIRVCKV